MEITKHPEDDAKISTTTLEVFRKVEGEWLVGTYTADGKIIHVDQLTPISSEELTKALNILTIEPLEKAGEVFADNLPAKTAAQDMRREIASQLGIEKT